MDNLNTLPMGTDEEDFYSEENLATIGDLVEEDKEVVEAIVEEPIESSKEEEEEEPTEDEETQAKSYSISLEDLGGELEMDDSDETFSSDERLRLYADQILSNCFGDRQVKKYALDKLFSMSNTKLFRDENYILYSVLYQFRAKIKQINIDEEFLRLFLKRNKELIAKSQGLIDIGAYGELEGSLELGYISGAIKHYKRLLTLEELSEVEFNTVFEKYLIEFKSMETETALTRSLTILSDGMKLGGKTYMGFKDCCNFIRRKIAELEGIGDTEKGTGFSSARELLLQEKEGQKSYKISDFDCLTALNKVYGGVYTGMFYQVIAPPKAGKTKFLTRLAHTTAVKFGNNVTVWAEEGGTEGFLAELRAIHFDHTYNSHVSAKDKKFGVSQDVIIHDKFASDDLRTLELSSKLDLASNQDYGSIDFIDRPFNVETFISDIDTSVKSNNSSLVIIDYLQIIRSEGKKSEREAVSEAYKALLAYCKKNNVAVITPGQYKQDAIEGLVSKSKTDDAELRTAAGVSSEVIRTPDIIFAFWATTKDLQNNFMKILSMPCRFNQPFPEIPVSIDLGVCQFVSTE